MQTAKQAIKVTRVAEGWTWALVDLEGGLSARGAAPEQRDAMEMAWRAARSFTGRPSRPYPEIIVEHGRSEH